jgi:predicted nuclease with TOPRIM domain
MGNIVPIFFHTLVDKFEKMFYLIEDLEKEVNSLPHTIVSTNFIQLMEENTQLTREVYHLQTSIDEIREEVSPLQEDNNRLFEKYHTLKEDYDAIFL